MKKKIFISLCIQTASIAVTAFSLIFISIFLIPHLPLADKRSFHPLLLAQMTIDDSKEIREARKNMLLVMGSSVAERGINCGFLDDALATNGAGELRSSNIASGGFFAEVNLANLKLLLEKGIRPSRIVYGIFLQDLNAKSIIHDNTISVNDLSLELKEKNIFNAIRYGAKALAPMASIATLHIYLFAVNHAYNGKRELNFFERMTFGVNEFEHDSSYSFAPTYLKQLEEVVSIAKENNIPIAFFNAPLRPKIESLADLPYAHREEAYEAIYRLARNANIPIWNFDRPGLFSNEEFLDTYHVLPAGTEKFSRLLGGKVAEWSEEECIQDAPSTLF